MDTEYFRRLSKYLFLSSALVLGLTACSGNRPQNLGVTDGRFTQCPASPNCVSSFDNDAEHGFPVYKVDGDTKEVWQAVRTAVLQIERSEIIFESSNYLHVEVTSFLMGYVDDVQIYFSAENGDLFFYSASRLGYSDLGVNRKRMSALVEHIKGAGIKLTPNMLNPK